MTTLRSHAVIDAKPDEVWRNIADANGWVQWYPMLAESAVDGDTRTIVLQNGARINEAIVTNDAETRRFQYAITGGDVPVENHLGTLDVIDLDDGRSVFVYSTEIEPAELAPIIGPAVDEAVATLASKYNGGK